MTRRDARWWLPWRLVYWLGSFDIWCWADLVYWKTLGSHRPRRVVACALECTRKGEPLGCYCGYWDRVADGTWKPMSAGET